MCDNCLPNEVVRNDRSAYREGRLLENSTGGRFETSDKEERVWQFPAPPPQKKVKQGGNKPLARQSHQIVRLGLHIPMLILYYRSIALSFRFSMVKKPFKVCPKGPIEAGGRKNFPKSRDASRILFVTHILDRIKQHRQTYERVNHGEAALINVQEIGLELNSIYALWRNRGAI